MSRVMFATGAQRPLLCRHCNDPLIPRRANDGLGPLVWGCDFCDAEGTREHQDVIDHCAEVDADV